MACFFLPFRFFFYVTFFSCQKCVSDKFCFNLFFVLFSGQELWPLRTNQIHSSCGSGHNIVRLSLGSRKCPEYQVLQAESWGREGCVRTSHRAEKENLNSQTFHSNRLFLKLLLLHCSTDVRLLLCRAHGVAV